MASIALLLLIAVSVNIKLTSSFFLGNNRAVHNAHSSSFSTSSSTARFALPASEYDQLLKDVTSNLKKGSVVVVKYGGHAMENEELKKSFCNDIAALCRNDIIPVIVHGGGPQIAAMLKRLDIESKFLDGLRVTDAATMEVAQMVLCGSINKGIAASISQSEGVVGALGLCGLDAGLIKAKQRDVKLGLVGEPTSVNAVFLRSLLATKTVPVIAPIGCDEVTGGSLNINADTAAGAVAEALKADVFLLLTDIVGVLDKEKKLIPKISPKALQGLKDDGTISGGMIPKLETAAQAVEAGVGSVSIMDGREDHCVLRALSGKVFGTQITF